MSSGSLVGMACTNPGVYTAPMQSQAATVQQYLAELPEERRSALAAVREVILRNLDTDYEEGMQYGMIGYYVPHHVFPAGYHCDPRQPLPFAGLASQKNYMSLYMMSAYGGGAEEGWLRKQWARAGKKLDMGKCCIRFKKLEDLALDVIGEAIRRVPAKAWIEHYEAAIRPMSTRASKAAGKPAKAAKPAKASATKAMKPKGRAKRAGLIPLALLATASLVASCASEGVERGAGGAATPARHAVAKVDPPTMADDAPRDYAGLHNVVAYHDGFYSGGVPEGEPGFDTLAGMGVRTIISVDGAAPDLDRAKARGMRTIHLPIGYDGFAEERKLELVRATRDAMDDGPVYIHCHHGKHRSAGAAGAVVASLGWLTPAAATDRMKVSGTAPGYTGLYACVAGAVVLGAATIDAVPADFPEVSVPAGFVKGMLEIDEINEHLEAIEMARWSVPEGHPDLVPVAEAARMADVFRLLAAGDMAKTKPADFAATMRDSSERAQVLEDMLAAGEADTRKLSGPFQRIAASCKDCHVKYRD